MFVAGIAVLCGAFTGDGEARRSVRVFSETASQLCLYVSTPDRKETEHLFSLQRVSWTCIENLVPLSLPHDVSALVVVVSWRVALRRPFAVTLTLCWVSVFSEHRSRSARLLGSLPAMPSASVSLARVIALTFIATASSKDVLLQIGMSGAWSVLSMSTAKA